MRRRAILLLMAMAAALALSTGAALAVTKQCKTIDPNTGKGVCFGTKERDRLLGTEGHNIMFGRANSDTLKGGGGVDILHGDKGNDRLFGGGSPNDLLYGGPGNDVSDGGEGDDSYVFDANEWGKDTINDSGATANQLHFGNTLNTGLTINLLSEDASPEVTNTAGTSTINWPINIIYFVRTDNDGNDTITGNAAANIINTWAGGGSDFVSTKGGDDYIDVRDRAGDDTVDCGEDISAFDLDRDEVHYDAGDVLVTPSHCESKHPG